MGERLGIRDDVLDHVGTGLKLLEPAVIGWAHYERPVDGADRDWPTMTDLDLGHVIALVGRSMPVGQTLLRGLDIPSDGGPVDHQPLWPYQADD